MKRINHDTYAAVAFLAIACFALWETRDLNDMSAMFPRTIGFILLGLSAVYFAASVFNPGKDELFTSVDRRRAVSMGLGMIAYVVFMWFAGFLLASLCFIAFFVWLLQGRTERRLRRVMRASFFSLLVGGGFYLLFRFVFLVPLPEGLLFGG